MVTSRLRKANDPRIHILIVHHQDEQRAYALRDATYSLGRDPENSIVLDEDAISRQHAILMRVPVGQDFGYRIEDGNLLGKPSTNGIKVNGSKCSSHDLKDGDTILFADKLKAEYFFRTQGDDNIKYLALRSIRAETSNPVSTTLLE